MEWTFVDWPLILKIRNPFQNYNMQTLTICSYASILARVDAYQFGIYCVPLELPHVFAHVVSTVHGTGRLLVAWIVCAHCHFFPLSGVGGVLLLWTCSACKTCFLRKRKEISSYLCMQDSA